MIHPRRTRRTRRSTKEWEGKDMFVTMRWQERDLVVSLDQLEGIAVDADTQEGIFDWHCWVEQGYEF
ncbi:MAG TPA: calcium-binding protein [Chloroflexia bacterium]|nr:calcium-binding protein [Chloroflexia bacterium]